jgi:hypothetical protein
MESGESSLDAPVPCKNPNCKRNDWKRSTILKHICHRSAKFCKSFYSTEDIEALKIKSKQVRDKKNAAKFRNDYNSEKRIAAYHSGKEKKAARKQHKKKYTSEARKIKYQNEKKLFALRLRKFRHECQFGPIFTCLCCKRDLFKRGVRVFKKPGKLRLKLIQNGTYRKFLALDRQQPFDENEPLRDFGRMVLDESLKANGNFHLCHSCIRHLEKEQMPPICSKNCLEYGEIPDCLDLNTIEKQLIVKNLIFIKVRQLHPTMMDAMNDRVVNVPICDDDIIKEVTSLPRTEKNSGMVNIKLKRKMGIKNYHKMGLIRPEKIYEALKYLKDHHPEYKDINIQKCDDWLNPKTEESEPECNNDDCVEDSDVTLDAENSMDTNNQTDETKSPNESDENMFNAVTCLLPEDPLNDVVGKLFPHFIFIFCVICIIKLVHLFYSEYI